MESIRSRSVSGKWAKTRSPTASSSSATEGRTASRSFTGEAPDSGFPVQARERKIQMAEESWRAGHNVQADGMAA